MKGTERNGLENKEIERARKEFGLIAHFLSPKIIRRLMRSFLNCKGDEKGAEKQIANLKLGFPGKNRHLAQLTI